MTRDPILIVDDEAEVRSTLLEALLDQGYAAETAASGEEAIAVLARRPFSLVITDLHMPGGISGLELLATIRQRHPDVLCILITAFATLDSSIEALQRGAYDLIQKPFRLSEIEIVVERAMDHARLVKEVAAYREELEIRILGRTRDLQEAHQEALALCGLTLQGLDAERVEAALDPLLDRLEARWAPEGLACYRRQGDRLEALVRRGSRPLPASLDPPGPGVLPPPDLGYPEARFVPLGTIGWLYLGFEERSAFSEADPAFLLLARHLELILRVCS